MNYIQFDFITENAEQAEQLIALLNEQGFEGFEEEDNELKAFIAEDKFNETGLTAVTDLFADLIYSRSTVENINWNQKWEEDFEPVLVNDFVGIRADFHLPIKNIEHEIIITPKMSFGTGHHATTHLMILQMQLLDFRGKNVLDFGTGTGVLAILAEKLGAGKVLAIDNDEWSIANAGENILQNDCSRIAVAFSDSIPPGEKYDIVLANINLNVILPNLQDIYKISNKDCKVLISGFLKENEKNIIAALEELGFTYLSTVQKGEWIAILAEK